MWLRPLIVSMAGGVAVLVGCRWAGAGVGLEAMGATGIRRGIAVHGGTTDGAVEKELADTGQMVVQGLVTETAKLAGAREAVCGLSSAVSVVAAETSRTGLPYGPRTVNLVICDLDALGGKAITKEELLRVTAPGGAVYARKGGLWKVTRPGRPAGMVEWPSFDGGAGTPFCSGDATIRSPLELRWVDGPLIGQTPAEVDTWNLVSAGGRLFTVTNMDDANVYLNRAVRPLWIVARDAYNGTRLWRKPYPFDLRKDIKTALRIRVWGLIGASAKRVFTWNGAGGISSLDAATGEDEKRIATRSPRRAKYVAKSSLTKYLLCGGPVEA